MKCGEMQIAGFLPNSEMEVMFRPTFGNLMNDVVAYGSCTECAMCVVVCPYGVIQYIEGKPRQTARPNMPQDYCVVTETIGCDVCAQVCPRLPPMYRTLDEQVFGRAGKPAEASFGVYEEIYAVRAGDQRILSACQDGGLVTAILVWGLETGYLDGAVVCGPGSKPCLAEPRIVDDFEDLLRCAGSWYTYSPNPHALAKIENTPYKRLGFVGTSCQITPILKSQLQGDEVLRAQNAKQAGHQLQKLKAAGERVELTIGLLCCEVFSYQGLMAGKIQGEMGIPLESIRKFNVKGKVLIYTKDGRVLELPLKDAKAFQRPECRYCADFAAEHADISAGGVGMMGWTVTIVRSSKGKAVMDALIESGRVEARRMDENENSLKILRRLAAKSRSRVT